MFEATVVPALFTAAPGGSRPAPPPVIVPPTFASSPIDLLARLPPAALAGIDVPSVSGPLPSPTVGRWTACEGGVISPCLSRAVIELDAAPPANGYRLSFYAEPLGDPNALVLPLALGAVRFVAVLGLNSGGGSYLSGLEAVRGMDVGNASNPTRTAGPAPFSIGQRSFVVADVSRRGVTVSVDGELLVEWNDGLDALEMQWWWQTPHPCVAIGALHCSFRITGAMLHAVG
jgi:hypothetical protein